MEHFALRRPGAAQFRFGGAPVLPDPAVQRACHPVGSEISTCRNHLGIERKFAIPLDLAEVGGLPVADQRLQPGLPPGTHYLYLEVPATGGPPAVVSRFARCFGARVYAVDHRERPTRCRGHREFPGGEPAVVDHPETIPAELARLVRSGAPSGRFSSESVGRAPGVSPSVLLQVPARNMDLGVTIEVTLVLPEDTERKPFGVPQEPGGLMIAFGGALLGGGDAEGDAE